jgi:hypothetical protein
LSSYNDPGKKKKAADFYFTKKTADPKPSPVKNDFMMKEVTPPPQTPPQQPQV